MTFADSEDEQIPYEIEYSEKFNEQASAIDSTMVLIDSELVGLTFVIARIPKSFPNVKNTPMYYAYSDGQLRLKVYFRIYDRVIRLCLVERQATDDPQ